MIELTIIKIIEFMNSTFCLFSIKKSGVICNVEIKYFQKFSTCSLNYNLRTIYQKIMTSRIQYINIIFKNYVYIRSVIYYYNIIEKK